jgi:hypothetical protein
MQVVVTIGVFLLGLFFILSHNFVSIASDGVEHQLVVSVQFIVIAKESKLRISRLLGFKQHFHLTTLLRDEESRFFNDGMLLHVGGLQETTCYFCSDRFIKVLTYQNHVDWNVKLSRRNKRSIILLLFLVGVRVCRALLTILVVVVLDSTKLLLI